MEHLATLDANGSKNGQKKVAITIVDCGVCCKDYKDENIFIYLFNYIYLFYFIYFINKI